MLRNELQTALKRAGETGNSRSAAILRLVLAALEQREREARAAGIGTPLDDEAIRELLRDMIAQRRADIRRCEAQARVEDAEREAEEIRVLERFLPAMLSDSELSAAVSQAIAELGVHSLKDAGRVMALLKERYNGRIDCAAAKKLVCARLSC